MRVLEAGKGKAVVELSDKEIVALNNALNEVCNGIEIPEFATRMGVQLSEAKALLANLKEIRVKT